MASFLSASKGSAPKDEELWMMEGLGRTLVSTEVLTGAIGSEALSESVFAQMEKV